MTKPRTPIHRMTEQRRVILEELRKLRTHPTVEEVYRLVRRRLPRVSLATVYRNLETLSADGLVLKIEIPGGSKRFDGHPEPHVHIRCVGCGRVGDIFATPRLAFDPSLQRSTDFRVLGCSLDLLGLCPHCRKKAA